MHSVHDTKNKDTQKMKKAIHTWT